jgi:hypothetical protein
MISHCYNVLIFLINQSPDGSLFDLAPPINKIMGEYLNNGVTTISLHHLLELLAIRLIKKQGQGQGQNLNQTPDCVLRGRGYQGQYEKSKSLVASES